MLAFNFSLINLAIIVNTLVLLAGLTWPAGSARSAEQIVGDPDAALLERAGRLALDDPGLASAAVALCYLALAGCESLGPRVVSGADLSAAAEFFNHYTRNRRSPACVAAQPPE